MSGPTLALGFAAVLAAGASLSRRGSRSGVSGGARSDGLLVMAPKSIFERAVSRGERDLTLLWSRDTGRGLTYGHLLNHYEGGLDLAKSFSLVREVDKVFSGLRVPFKVYRGVVVPAGALPRQRAGDLGRHWSFDRDVAVSFATCEHSSQTELSDPCRDHFARGVPHEGVVYEGLVEDARQVDWSTTLSNAALYTVFLDAGGAVSRCEGPDFCEKEICFLPGVTPRILSKGRVRIP